MSTPVARHNFVSLHAEAVKLYSQAIAGCDTDTTLYSNRSAALLALGRLDEALWDAQKCVQLGPDWPKGYYRLGAAHMAMSEWSSAGAALKKGLGLAPGNKDMVGPAML